MSKLIHIRTFRFGMIEGWETHNKVVKDINIGTSTVKFAMMDPQGNECLTTATFYNCAQCSLAVFSVTDRDTLINCKNWLSYGERYIDAEKQIRVLVGTKIDQKDERVVTNEEAQLAARNLNCKYYECSAKTGEGITELYEALLKDMNSTFNVTPAEEKAKKTKSGKRKCVML